MRLRGRYGDSVQGKIKAAVHVWRGGEYCTSGPDEETSSQLTLRKLSRRRCFSNNGRGCWNDGGQLAWLRSSPCLRQPRGDQAQLDWPILVPQHQKICPMRPDGREPAGELLWACSLAKSLVLLGRHSYHTFPERRGRYPGPGGACTGTCVWRLP